MGGFGPFSTHGAPLQDDVARSIIELMNSATKLLLAMRRNPLDWQIAQLQTVARQAGIDWRHDGSAIVFLYAPMAGLSRCQQIAQSSRSTSRSLLIWSTESEP